MTQDKGGHLAKAIVELSGRAEQAAQAGYEEEAAILALGLRALLLASTAGYTDAPDLSFEDARRRGSQVASDLERLPLLGWVREIRDTLLPRRSD